MVCRTEATANRRQTVYYPLNYRVFLPSEQLAAEADHVVLLRLNLGLVVGKASL